MSIAEDIALESLRLVLEDRVVVHRNARPEFLTNPDTGCRLELDFYLPDQNIGIEIQGLHHYRDEAQISRDCLKRALLAMAGVYLVELSIFQIGPVVLSRKLYGAFSEMKAPLHLLRSFSPSWLEFEKRRCARYKKGILTTYGRSEATTAPAAVQMSVKKQKLHEEICGSSFVRFKIHGTQVRARLLRPYGKRSFVVRPFGTQKELIVKQKNVELIR